MIYLINSGCYAKIGYARNLESFNRTMDAYESHNPRFTVMDLQKGTMRDAKRLQGLYGKFTLDNGGWCCDRRMVVEAWLGHCLSLGYDAISLKCHLVSIRTKLGAGGPHSVKASRVQMECIGKDLFHDVPIDLAEEYAAYSERHRKPEECDFPEASYDVMDVIVAANRQRMDPQWRSVPTHFRNQ